MFEKLKKLLDNSYAPYSNFRVASILVTKDGKEFNGVNVENASYGACICSERSALVSSVSAGYKKGDFEALYLIVDSDKISYPCNLCRQVFVEFFNDDIKIVCYNKNGESNAVTVADLCTYSFNSEDLKWKVDL